MDIIFKRRSIRNYSEKAVEDEKIEKILEAAMMAPSAGNQQPWEFLVIKDKEKLKKLSMMSNYSKMIKDSALTIIMLSNEENLKFPENWEQDMAAATENLLLEVAELGLGGVWLGVAPLEDRMNYITEMFNLPINIKPFCVVPIGYPAGKKNEYINRFDENRIHYEKY